MACPIAVQLYSVRDHLGDLDATLARLAAAGADAVEPFWILDDPEKFGAQARRHGLATPTAMSPFLSDELIFDGQVVPLPPAAEVFDAALRLGVTVLIDPMVPAEQWAAADDIRRTADRLNAAAEATAAFGLSVGYHNHSFEFHHEVDGTSAYEYFVSLLDSRVVLEVDVFWAALAGQDVPALLLRLGQRVAALHLKDGVLGEDPFRSGGSYAADDVDQRPAGAGELDLVSIVDAAPERRVDVIEFDFVRGDPFVAVHESIRFLRAQRTL